MKKRLAALAAVATILSGLGILSATPAHALHQVCVAQGTATLSAGLGLPVLTNKSVTFDLTGNASVCTVGGVNASVTANGSLNGACGLSSGGGTVNAGGVSASFTYQSAASVLVLSGGVRGAVNAVADASAGSSCAATTAVKFQVQGTFAFTA